MSGAESRASRVTKTYKTTIVRDGSVCFIPVTFDPKPVFGKARAPVKVTVNGYTYRSTIAAMGGPPCIPLRRSNREAAGLEGGETLEVRLELDTDAREVKPPAAFVSALKAAPPAWPRWRELSYSHQREYVEAIEEAKKPETRPAGKKALVIRNAQSTTATAKIKNDSLPRFPSLGLETRMRRERERRTDVELIPHPRRCSSVRALSFIPL